MSATTVETVIHAPATRRVVVKHHALVRLSHWANVPLLFGLIVTGLSIYWAAPVYQHPPDRVTRSTDYIADVGTWIVKHVPGAGSAKDPGDWIYDSLGLALGDGYKALLPRSSDVPEALRMIRYYIGVVPAKLLRRPWPHPSVGSKYNALQRGAYFLMPLLGILAVASGWAIHKPVQLPWLERLFVNYNGARFVHFWVMVAFAAFVVPHVVLVIVDGWDTFRSMVTGWSERLREGHGRD